MSLPYKYELAIGQNGEEYVLLDSVPGDHISVGKENSKLGVCLNYAFPIESTCKHCCECYSVNGGNGLCYGQHGRFMIPDNKAVYANNYRFIQTHNRDEILAEFDRNIALHPEIKNFRHFEVGDIPTEAYIEIMCTLAIRHHDMKFWAYTKKYELVNRYCFNHGCIPEKGKKPDCIPENLVIVFSEWMNSDGTYLHMNNPFDFPLSRFIPVGKENLIGKNDFICPCSDPGHIGFCITCEHSCRDLKHGQSMCLLEHSTGKSKARDKSLSEARKAHKEEQEALLKEIKKELSALRKVLLNAIVETENEF